VVVYKLTVEGTVEERILALQERKRLLAEHAIEGSMKKDAFKLGLKEMLELFRHDGGKDLVAELDKVMRDRDDGVLTSLSKPRVTATAVKEENPLYGRRW
jgi:hypothetical protein